MTTKSSSVRALLACAMLAMAVLLILELRVRDVDESGLTTFQRENLAWHATQLQSDALHFALAVASYDPDLGKTEAENVAQRFDLLWSRHATFGSGEIGERLMAIEGSVAVAALGALLEQHEAAAMAIQKTSQAERLAMSVDFETVAELMRVYISNVDNVEEEQLARVYRDLVQSNRFGRAMGMVAAVVVIMLGVAALILARQDRARLAAQRSMTLAAECAAEAKSRFLTMMSHELRTPMNGVLGVLGVLQSTRIDERQAKLIELARSSAGEMLGLVEDILDLSDIEVGRREAEIEAISLDMLAAQIVEATTLRLNHRDPELRVDVLCAPDTVIHVDRRIVVKAVRQISVFLLERLRIGGNTIRLDVRDGRLIAAILAPEAASAQWDPASVLGPLTDPDAPIQTEAIGPALARALIADAGGSVEMWRSPEEGLGIELSLPIMSSAAPGGAAPVDKTLTAFALDALAERAAAASLASRRARRQGRGPGAGA